MKRSYSLIIIIIILSIISISIGNMNMAWPDLFATDGQAWQILLISRLPRLLAVLFTGIGLSISGLILQQLVQNKFVSPATAATQDSARLGIMVSLILFSQMSVFNRSLFAFVFALAGTGLFLWLVQRIQWKDVVIVPLLGMMMGMIIEALTTFLALKYDVLQALSAYMIGSFTLTIKGRYEMLYVIIPLVLLAYGYARAFNIASLGKDFATSLGLHYRRVVVIGLVLIALMNALIIVTVGSIAFVGLIIPNIVSLIYGDKLEDTLTLTAGFGAIFLLIADIFSRIIIFPYEVPISLTIGVSGSLIFLYLIFRGKIYAR